MRRGCELFERGARLRGRLERGLYKSGITRMSGERGSAPAAIALILEEHQHWNLLDANAALSVRYAVGAGSAFAAAKRFRQKGAPVHSEVRLEFVIGLRDR